jgi:TRAP-type mannitol/chloroaromatic compound transport system substrate-binding protein
MADVNRRKFLQVAGAGGAAAAAAAVASPAIAQSAPELKWRLTSSFPKSLDTIYGAAEIFAKSVAESTDNKFQIQVFAGRRDRARPAGADAVTSGTVEMCQHGLLLLGQGPDVCLRHGRSVRAQLPYANAWMYEGRRHRPDERLLCQAPDLRPAGRQHRRSMGGWYRKEINTPTMGLKDASNGFAGA